MAYPGSGEKSFWRNLFLGEAQPVSNPEPVKWVNPNDAGASPQASAIKKAVKCDMCKDLSGGPACVRACPTGAANRLSPEQFVQTNSGRVV